jgi:hypothetical protein
MDSERIQILRLSGDAAFVIIIMIVRIGSSESRVAADPAGFFQADSEPPPARAPPALSWARM